MMKMDIENVYRSSKENLFCVDCEGCPSTHASLLYGIFICEKCARVHQGLRLPYFHPIKSLDSEWGFTELNLVAKGGNSDFLSFLSLYNIPVTSAPEYKYSTIACKYYREHLQALALNTSCDFPTPTLEEAVKTEPFQSSFSFLESIESKKKTFEAFTEINSLKAINEKTSDLFKNIKNGLRVKALESFEVFDHLIDLGKEKSSVIVKKVRSGTDLLKQTADSGRLTVESGSRLLTEGLNKGRSLINDGVLYIRSASFSPSLRKRGK